MARLSDSDVNRLVASLGSGSASLLAPRQLHAAPARSLDPRRLQDAQKRLGELSRDGSLGPLVTQRLAAYLNRPVRCTSGDPSVAVDLGRAEDSQRLDRPNKFDRSIAADDDVCYTAQAAGVRYWLRTNPLLAGAIADAMIGGEGDASKVGSGLKVLRLAAGAVTEFLRGVADALDLPEPAPAALDRAKQRDLTALARGSLSIATHTFGWEVGLLGAGVHATPAAAQVAPESMSPILSAAQFPPAGGLEGALESARSRLEQLVRQEVKFDALQTERLASARMPAGWLRMSLAMRAGGAAILAVDRQGAASLVNCALAADLVDSESGSAFAQSGAEVILMNAIQAFAAALPGPPDDLRHTVRLTDEAIPAELPHQSIEHRFAAGHYAGVLHWLIPDSALHPRGAVPGSGRGASV